MAKVGARRRKFLPRGLNEHNAARPPGRGLKGFLHGVGEVGRSNPAKGNVGRDPAEHDRDLVLKFDSLEIVIVETGCRQPVSHKDGLLALDRSIRSPGGRQKILTGLEGNHRAVGACEFQ